MMSLQIFKNSESSRPQRRGFTLTELAIVLGIIGTILGAIWVASAKVSDNRRISKAVQQTLMIAQGVRAVYANKGTVDNGDLTAMMVNFGVFPSDMVQNSGCPAYVNMSLSSNCPVSAWGGGIQIGGPNVGWWGAPTTASNTFDILYWSPSMPNCAGFLATLVPAAVNSGLVWVYAAGGVGAVTVNNTTPVSAFSACTGYVTLQFQL